MAQTNGSTTVETSAKVPDGIVLPPKDIRAIVEKTAGYVARNGPVFEDRIREKEQSNAKFSFLAPNDAYTPFYHWRLSEIKAGRNADLSGSRNTVARDDKPKGPAPPPEFQFSARMPNISALDLEVLRLTALHTARKGKSWMTNLSQKEARNYQFDFLRPQHSLYSFFQRMVDQYSLLLQTGPEGQKAEQTRIQAIQANIQDRLRTLELAKKRSEYVKYTETQKQRKEEAEEAEKIAYAQVDWHDFVVVETVVFTDADEQAELPPPTTLNDLQTASLEQKAMMGLSRPDMRLEEAMPTDDMDAYNDYHDNFEQNQNGYHSHQPQQAPAHTPAPAPQYIPLQPTSASQPRANPTPVQAPTAPAPMRIRQDYVPRAQQRTQQHNQTSICPNCGQRIPNSELDEHLRIELLDPSWKEQQNKNAERFSTTNMANMDVAGNLKRLHAQAAAGSNDPVAHAAARVMDDEDAARKRPKVGEGQSVDQQLRGLQNRYGR